MTGRSRIRWENVAKLGAGGIACLAVAAGLPAMLRRPEPPPLEADIGFAPAATRPVEPRIERGRDRHQRPAPTPRGSDRPGRVRHRRDERPKARLPEHRTGARSQAASSAPTPPLPAPAPSTAPAPSPPAPVTPPKPPAPPAPPHPDPPPPSRPSEFGFER